MVRNRTLRSVQVTNVTHVTGTDKLEMVARDGIEPSTRGLSIRGSQEDPGGRPGPRRCTVFSAQGFPAPLAST
jgi:hypothetical protein